MKKSNDHETMILSEGKFAVIVRDREGIQNSHFQDLKAGVQNRLYRLSWHHGVLSSGKCIWVGRREVKRLFGQGPACVVIVGVVTTHLYLRSPLGPWRMGSDGMAVIWGCQAKGQERIPKIFSRPKDAFFFFNTWGTGPVGRRSRTVIVRSDWLHTF